ncbi:hypothetical protein OC845_004702 [Tilletia horrida]|nr:hypothetical protein OC845_004702 [Tilletia horrida]
MSDHSPSSSDTDTSGDTIASLGSADFFLPSDTETEEGRNPAIEVVVPSRRHPTPSTVEPEAGPIKLLESIRAFGLLQVEPIDDLFVITQQAEYFTQMASRGNDPGLAAMVQDALDIVCKRPVRTAAVRAYRRASGSHIHAFYKAVIKSSRAAERIKLSLHALIVGPPPATLLL